MGNPRVPTFQQLIRRYIDKGIHWGDATTETFGGMRADRWDCSYFVARIIRDILGDQSFGHDQPLKYVWAAQQFRRLCTSEPGVAGFSLPMIGLSNMEEEEELWQHIVHIAFLVGPVVWKVQPTIKDAGLDARYLSGGIVDPDRTFVCDLAQNASVNPTHDEIAVHPISWWFPDGYDMLAAQTDGRMTQTHWSSTHLNPQVKWVLRTGAWLNEVTLAKLPDAFNPELRSLDQPIP